MLKPCCVYSLKSLLLLGLLTLVACGGSSNKTSTPDSTPSLEYSLSGSIVIPLGSDVDNDVQTNSFALQNNDFSTAQQINNPAFLGGYLSAIAGIYTTSNSDSSPHTYSADPVDIYQVSLLSSQTISMNVFFADSGDSASSEMNIGFRVYSSSNTLSPMAEKTLVAEGASSIQVTQNDDYYIVISADSAGSVPILYTLSISQTASSNVNVLSRKDVDPNALFVPGEVIVKYKPGKLTDSSASIASQSTLTNGANKPSAAISLQKKMPLGSAGHLMKLEMTDGGVSSSSSRSTATQSMISGLSASQINALPQHYRDKWQTAALINQLRQNPEVEYAEPNYIRAATYVPTDPEYPKQWHYPLINLPSAWNVATGSGVTVAVIDTGIASTHVDLDDNIDSANGWDFISNVASAGDGDGPDNNPEDEAGSFHGSHVAGIIAAEEGNGLGIVGSAFDARIMPLRVLGIDGFGADSEISQAILYAAGLTNSSGTLPSQKADIINLSLGSESFSSSLQSAINAALAESVIIIAAAGNNASSVPFYPAAFDGVVSVSAVSETKSLASFSNYGSTIDVAAPGGSGINDLNNDRYRDGILSTVYASFYEELQGTSMAAPHVAGVAALMKSKDPSLDSTKFLLALESGDITDNIGASSQFGAGLINAAKALAWVGESISTQLNVFPSSFSFVGSTTSSSFTLSNPGDGTVLIESISENETWLEVLASDVDEQLLGTYSIAVDRTGLAEGSNYATEVSINYRIDGGELETQRIQVFLSVPSVVSSANVGEVFVLLTRKSDLEEAEENNAPFVDIYSVATASYSEGQYQFNFSGIPSGEYVLDASTDNDNDFIVSDQGEAVGAYPLNSQPVVVTVTNSNITGLNFSMSYPSFTSSSLNTRAGNTIPSRKMAYLKAPKINNHSESQLKKRKYK